MNQTRRNFQRLLKQARPYLPKDQLNKVNFHAVPPGQGFATADQDTRTISGNPSYRRQLKKKPDMMRFTTYHELGHIMGAGSEGHANRNANLLIRAERGKLSKRVARRKIRNNLNVQDG